MNLLIMGAVDLAAIVFLTFGLYLRRHRRRDLAVSYLGINIGVFGVAATLSGSSIGIGVGMGLFGVLSIIRLRSNELEQHEIAYYFSALAVGLIAGLVPTPLWLGITLIALILTVIAVADHSRILPRYRHQEVVLDRAIADEAELTRSLEAVLGGRVHSAIVQQLDLVNDKTLVKVRFSAGGDAPARSAANHEVLEPAVSAR
ncbi:DUF4956 domain-containing protein [Zhihengliuella halotolerans]|uniref:Uncharacterized protein DUF4956 n=1 Tax=Zhihengliuella halotolerans TaxID=370736 RepID=A0A4Q8AGL9_9MICC|nr:DUF4956 domain-containing protein [Zhihengliuella halotolerans]RZU63512.1 uncharacterized protein DUF4956 [Zhihengliuella halotolerans]